MGQIKSKLLSDLSKTIETLRKLTDDPIESPSGKALLDRDSIRTLRLALLEIKVIHEKVKEAKSIRDK